MPCLKILTNLPQSAIPKDFVNKIIPVLSRSVKKEPGKFICLISGNASVTFGGESELPGAVATLESIGNLGPEQNKVISKEVTEFIRQELGIPPNRFFLTFYDVQPYNVAISGNTVDNP